MERDIHFMRRNWPEIFKKSTEKVSFRCFLRPQLEENVCLEVCLEAEFFEIHELFVCQIRMDRGVFMCISFSGSSFCAEHGKELGFSSLCVAGFNEREAAKQVVRAVITRISEYIKEEDQCDAERELRKALGCDPEKVEEGGYHV